MSWIPLLTGGAVAKVPMPGNDAAVVVRSALDDPTFSGWTLWPVGEATTSLALASDGPTDVEDGLRLLSELTPRMSSEFAIRPFLAADLDRSLAVVRTWTSSPDPHVRRLASEGTRPYLPWAVRVKAIVDRPDATIGILDDLYRDEDEVVRRSVANHLNDLHRHAPALVIETATRWSAAPDANTAWVVRHALRNLVKQGMPEALALQGFSPAEVAVSNLTASPDLVHLPGDVTISFDVTNRGEAPADLAVDYVVHFRKKNGSLAGKVFKLATRRVAAGATASFTKRHAMHQMTTRVHHPGVHEVEAQVNGRRYGRATFDVVV